MAGISAVLFDFDGVIVDSEPLHLFTFRELLKPLGVKITKKRWYSEFTGIGSTAIMGQLFLDYGIKEDVGRWVEMRMALYQMHAIGGKLKLLPGARQFLLYIRKKGIKAAIVSGGHAMNIIPLLGKLRLKGMFDTIVSLEDVKNRKPHPEGFLLAAMRLGVKPQECLAIEDSISGAIAVKSAGMALVCIKSPSPIKGIGCDFLIRDFRKFPKGILE